MLLMKLNQFIKKTGLLKIIMFYLQYIKNILNNRNISCNNTFSDKQIFG